MACRERDGMSKMQHVIHTIKNMLRYLVDATEASKVHVSVIAFDDRTECVIDKVLLTNDNLQDLVAAVDRIYARDMTNIGAAIDAANKQRRDFVGEAVHTHILLTDGNATCGAMDSGVLRALLDTSHRNVFIGYGIDHSMQTLQTMADYDQGKYYFVESAESAGNVYGEVLHDVLYELMTGTIVTVEGAEAYDWRTNTWGGELRVGSLPAGVERVFHLRQEVPPGGGCAPVDLVVSYTSCGGEHRDSMAVPASRDTNEDDPELTRYTYRQQAMELMYEAKEGGTAGVERQIQDLASRITEAMEACHDPDRAFMRNLLDDLRVAEESLRSQYGALYLGARRVSQGDQRAHNVVDLDAMGRPGPGDAQPQLGRVLPFSRATQFSGRQLSGGASPYACAAQSRLMRQCSAQASVPPEARASIPPQASAPPEARASTPPQADTPPKE